MEKTPNHISFASRLKNIDWMLLLFLLLFLDVKMIVKLFALAFIYSIYPSLRFGFRFKASRLPLFYPAVIMTGLLNYIFTAGFTSINYSVAFFTGVVFWTLAILAGHQIKLATERSSLPKLYNTLFLFFMLNAAVTGLHLLRIIVETGEWNPYMYQGLYQKYFIGTGDYIKGITFDTSTTNAVINAFGIVFFLHRDRFIAALVCMSALLLTCSNFVNLTVLFVFVWCFIVQSTRARKSIIVVCICMLVLFMAKISPQNNEYALHTFEKIFTGKVAKKNTLAPIPVELRSDSSLTPEEKKYKTAKLYILNFEKNISLVNETSATKNASFIRPSLPVNNIHSAPFQHRQDSTAARLQAIRYALSIGRDTSMLRITAQKLPGKLLAVQQTLDFMRTHPARILLGAGIGNFSSKLAFRTTGLQVAGGYPEKYIYVNDDFRKNQLAIFLDYFDKDSGFHSITNSPNNVYVQMLGEYGIAGLTALFVLYGWFFVKRAVWSSYAVPLLILTGCVLFVEYWFEQLSVLVLFELMLFIHQKEKGARREHEQSKN